MLSILVLHILPLTFAYTTLPQSVAGNYLSFFVLQLFMYRFACILSAATLHRYPNLFPYDYLEYVPGHLGAIVSAQI